MPPKGHRKSRPSYTCKECGRSFSPKYPSVKQVYCSKSCRGKGINRERTVASSLRVKKPTVPLLNEAEKGYLAAMIDGEGTISLRDSKATEKTTANLTPWVMVSNTNTKILEKVSQITHVEYNKKAKRSKHEQHRKPAYKWQIQSMMNVRFLLEQVMPYLAGKQEQAQLVLEFISKKLSKKLGDGITREEREIQSQLKTLNRRGIP